MVDSKKIIALKATLKSMEKQLGFLEETSDSGDNRLIVIIHNAAFINISVAEIIFKMLNIFLRHRLISLIATDGAYGGEVSTNWLKDIKDHSLKDSIVKALFDDGRLTAIEYCHIYAPNPFVLFGAEDEKLHRRATELWGKLAPLWKFLHENESKMPVPKLVEAVNNSPTLRPLYQYWEEFNTLDNERAEAILKNLLQKMAESQQTTSALICIGNLPKYISEKAKARAISYVIFNPVGANTGDLEKYEKRLEEQIKNLKAND